MCVSVCVIMTKVKFSLLVAYSTFELTSNNAFNYSKLASTGLTGSVLDNLESMCMLVCICLGH